jgi:flagellar hook protein FlgE
MGIFDALNTSVGGLQAQSFALQNISGNIANASTVGYKGIDTSFEDLVAQSSTPTSQVAGGVTALSQQTLTTAGTVSASTVATNMAINGDGFFSVQKPTSIVDNQPVFNGVTDYTRAGDFQVNANGNLVNGAGYYLMGVAVDPKTGNPLGNVSSILQFQNNFVPAQATSVIQYAANLPTTPTTTASATATSGTITASGGLNPADFSQSPLVLGTPPTPFTNSSVTGKAAASTSGPVKGNTLLSNTELGSTTGSAVLDNTSAPISSTTLLSSLANQFGDGDTLTVNGKTITFSSTAATTGGSFSNGGTISLTTGTVQDILTAIDKITGTSVPSTIDPSSGAITLNTGTAMDLSVSSTASGFTALGFTATMSAQRGGGGGIGQGVVLGKDLTAFTNESISGGAVTAYNAAGTPVNLQLRWALVSNASGQETWNLFYQSNTAPGATDVAWTNVGTNFTFNSDGSLSSPSGAGITIPGMSVNNQSLGNVTMNLGSGGLTNFASTTGSATVNLIQQNGYAAGQLQSVAISNNGLVVGTFSNGQNLDLAQVTLSHFNGTNYLQALSGEAYAVTEQSGPAIAGASGTISGSSLEGSNTDIADEFTKLIVTQQAYSANTKVITTANDMVQDLLNVLR